MTDRGRYNFYMPPKLPEPLPPVIEEVPVKKNSLLEKIKKLFRQKK